MADDQRSLRRSLHKSPVPSVGLDRSLMQILAVGRRLNGERFIEQGKSLHQAQVIFLARGETMCHQHKLGIAAFQILDCAK